MLASRGQFPAMRCGTNCFYPPQNCVHTLTLPIPKAVGGQYNAYYEVAALKGALEQHHIYIYLFLYKYIYVIIYFCFCMKNPVKDPYKSAASH